MYRIVWLQTELLREVTFWVPKIGYSSVSSDLC